MKQLLLLLTCLLAAPTLQAQRLKEDMSTPTLPLDPSTHLVTYSGGRDAAGVSKDQLYGRALEWVAQRYHTAGDAVQLQDKENGKIIVRCALVAHGYKHEEYGTVTHTLVLSLKDGHYDFAFSNFRHDYVTVGVYAKDCSIGPFESNEPQSKAHLPREALVKKWNILRRYTDADIKEAIASLEAAMNEKAEAKSKL